MKRAVVYYSLTNQTKAAGEKIAGFLQADCIQIDTVKPMPDSKNKQIMYGGMLASFGIKPKLKAVPDLSEYEEVIIGTPIWAGKMAPAINTLFKDSKILGKVVGVYMLSGSGNAQKCQDKMKEMLPNLKTTVSLADDYNELSANKNDLIKKFCEELNQ